eukprot:scaffold109935_cov32-Tisochrysis_lutea.AAC.5
MKLRRGRERCAPNLDRPPSSERDHIDQYIKYTPLVPPAQTSHRPRKESEDNSVALCKVQGEPPCALPRATELPSAVAARAPPTTAPAPIPAPTFCSTCLRSALRSKSASASAHARRVSSATCGGGGGSSPSKSGNGTGRGLSSCGKLLGKWSGYRNPCPGRGSAAMGGGTSYTATAAGVESFALERRLEWTGVESVMGRQAALWGGCDVPLVDGGESGDSPCEEVVEVPLERDRAEAAGGLSLRCALTRSGGPLCGGKQLSEHLCPREFRDEGPRLSRMHRNEGVPLHVNVHVGSVAAGCVVKPVQARLSGKIPLGARRERRAPVGATGSTSTEPFALFLQAH